MIFSPNHRRPRNPILRGLILGLLCLGLSTAGCAEPEPPSEAEALRDDLDAASLDLIDALHEAELIAVGGTIIRIEFEHDEELDDDHSDDELEYRFEVYEGDALRRVDLDAVTGEINEDRLEPLDESEMIELAVLAGVVEGANISLEEAILAADDDTGGEVFKIEAEESGVLEAEVLVDGQVYEVEIDPDSGEVIKRELDDNWPIEDE